MISLDLTMKVGEDDVKLFALNSGVEAVAVPLLEKVMSPQLAVKFFHKYNCVKTKIVPKLTEICSSLIAKNKYVINTLFSIYGAETNFPIPTHVVNMLVQNLDRCLDCETVGKLSLLLINNNTTEYSFSTNYRRESGFSFSSSCNEQIWKKLYKFAANKIVSLWDDVHYYHVVPRYYLIDFALPYLGKFANVQNLKMQYTLLEEDDILELASAMPNLKALCFGFGRNVTTTYATIRALAELSNLEEIELYLIDDDVDEEEKDDLYDILGYFISRCLKANPRLKLAGTSARSYSSRGHICHMIPTYKEPTELALEHLVVDQRLHKACSNSRLPNVKYLRIFGLKHLNDVKTIVDLGLEKLEELHLVMDCHSAPIMALISSVALTVSDIAIDDGGYVGGLDFLRIIDLCPNLKNIYFCVLLGENGYCTFGGFEYLQQPHSHLQSVNICVGNKSLNHKLPSGAVARLLCAPNIEYLDLADFKYPEQDCHILISKMQSGCKILQKLATLIYSAEESSNIVPVLFATMATFCPKLETIHCESAILDNDVFKMISPALQKVISLEAEECVVGQEQCQVDEVQ